MAQDVINNDLLVNGNIYAKAVIPSVAGITDVGISATAAIQATKLQHQHQPCLPINADDLATAAVGKKVIHVVYGTTGTIVAFRVGSVVAAIGAATVTIDLKRNGTTILTATYNLTSSNAAFALVAPAGFTSTSLVTGDVLEAHITAVAAGGGTLPVGVFAQLIVREDAA